MSEPLWQRALRQLEINRSLDGVLPFPDFGWIHLGHEVEPVPASLPDGTTTSKLVCHTDKDVSSLPDESDGKYIAY